ncbi:hypothetical protein E2C01_031405 [Portunus trituberculatus]|uniref:Uncharacterized protein n=1 Tax=Portunus trituberculatus TaxID=210409 RepID=A0A5B7ESR4_PORTR|nr:hypothetical protein [Portunus trituberculatus]
MSFFTFPVPRFLFRGSGDARDDKAHQQSRQKESKSNKSYESSDHQQQLSGHFRIVVGGEINSPMWHNHTPT